MRKKKVRVKDIARRLGISPATVSQALNHPEQVNRSTRREVLSLCEDMGYLRPQKGRKRKYNIAVVSGDTHNFTQDFFAAVSAQLLIYAKKKNYNLIFEPWADAEDDFPISISKNKVDGIISLGATGYDKVVLIKQKHLPLVLCGHPLHNLEVHTVLPDGRSGIYQACKYLISLGHKRIATISAGNKLDPIAQDRLEGYHYALAEAGMPIPDDYVVTGNIIHYTEVKKQIDKLMSLKNPPTAIVCANDPIAYSVYVYLKQKGIKVPQDISITGFDNFKPPNYSVGMIPKLTTVNVNTKELAKHTLDIIFELMKNPKKIAWRYTLPVQVEVGETTAPPAK